MPGMWQCRRLSLRDSALLVIASGSDSDHAGAVEASEYQLCANRHLAECNWLGEGRAGSRAVCIVPTDPHTAPRHRHSRDDGLRERRASQTAAHSRTRGTRPSHRRTRRGLRYGLAFDLLSSACEKVFTGHDNGIITLDLAEGDDVHREQLRVAMDEPYRTLLGHFRHEIGHYYFYRLIGSSPDLLSRSRELFGDPDADYQEALDRHYSQGAPSGWDQQFVPSYATMHPAEDWAETFAHYLHIRDTLDTAAAFGFAPANAGYQQRVLGPQRVRHDDSNVVAVELVAEHGQPLDGQGRPVPVRVAGAGPGKMRFIHNVIDEATADG